MTNFHLMAKPAGPSCNLNCTYCFYLEKESLFHEKKTMMPDEVLEAYTEKYIRSQSFKEINFAWQGGEPTMAGLDFFRKALKLQKRFNSGKKISNAIQTNGTLLTEEWCRFLAKNKFLVGLSLDGPELLHDAYRKSKTGGPTFKKLQRSLKLLKENNVEYNVLTTVNGKNSKEPLEVYNFLMESGVEYIQFIPIVERAADAKSIELGFTLSTPPSKDQQNINLTDWSVESSAYGDFLIAIFNQWVKNDVGSVFVMNFEWAFSSAIKGVSGICQFAQKCGNAGIVEHNGDIYSCDHYVYPEYKLGNIISDDPKVLFQSDQQTKFGNNKYDGLSKECRDCPVLTLCYGGCPKHRFIFNREEIHPQNYLCRGYKRFFTHILPYAEMIKTLIDERKPVTDLMKMTHPVV
ncbi:MULTISPECIES: anaerobic sulfatase maturase [unclassified Oceanispirochaeta]|uniref:anaerobic sulfatase maturase n=1 Tax=unclassified Oceanispirochaeta TaxID=2635722 RepID=UPI0014953B7B|nr:MULTISPECIES: anaerobic sulfatase maturase [unclassified Oceanispirochaeta]MBF9018301.1 anaerobic sulfatase maturase [Oceanispirochaeta sp. M2]